MPRSTAHDDVAVLTHDLGIAHSRSSRTGDARAVDGVDLRVEPGGALVVMGAAGSGKSTLLAILAGDETRDAAIVGGEGWVHGLALHKRGRTRRRLQFHVGYHAQRDGAELPPRLTVGDIIAEPVTSRDRRVNPHAMALRSAALLDELRLPLGIANKYPYELSAGMRQRVAFARALVLEPKILVADDPFANLATEIRPVVLEAIERRRREHAMTAVIATNDADIAPEMNADVLVLQHGHPVAQGRHDGVQWAPSAAAFGEGEPAASIS